MKRQLLVSLLTLSIAALAPGCNDDSNGPGGENFVSTLTGAKEQPARTTPATATANYTLRNDTLYWTINMSNITNVVAAHIHLGDVTVASGGIVLPLTPPVSNTLIQGFIFKGNFVAPGAPNQALTFDQMIAAMRIGGAYTNVHTNDGVAPTNTGAGDFPGGEIRGQINSAP
jgi:hypothetical protein